MLVLECLQNQGVTIRIPQGDIKIKFLRTAKSGRQIWLGVEAPKEIPVVRDELLLPPCDETDYVRTTIDEMEHF